MRPTSSRGELRWLAAPLALALAAVAAGPPTAPLTLVRPCPLPLPPVAEDSDPLATDGDPPLKAPTGEPPRLRCAEAKAIVRQARTLLATDAGKVEARAFAGAATDWLDPHGLWSAAPDASPGRAIRASAEALLRELETEGGACDTAVGIGKELKAWTDIVRQSFDEGRRQGAPGAVFDRASASPFQDGSVIRPSRELARELGRTIGSAEAAYGAEVTPFADAARRRYFPAWEPAEWSEAVLAAAVRAYLPLLDVHGAWAPFEEEVSVFDVDLERTPPARAFGDVTRVALGVRLEGPPLPPLLRGDLVLKVGDVSLAGVSVEQVEQLSYVSGDPSCASARFVVLRRGESAPLTLEIGTAEREADLAAGHGALDVKRERFGDGTAAVVRIEDVPDDLGERLETSLADASRDRGLRGVVLDLRGNGGGSTDGALDAISLFLPGVPMFPMRRRDGTVEIERAPAGRDALWAGPLAVLVDGQSASAAEMIAGGLGAYRRALVVGSRTYGKGCAQEYLDDDARAGVLRLTTLVFSLPDGAPLQRVGITPDVELGLPSAPERESTLLGALAPWSGPDVRERSRVRPIAWPAHGGKVGPCADDVVCRALRSLGSNSAAARAR